MAALFCKIVCALSLVVLLAHGGRAGLPTEDPTAVPAGYENYEDDMTRAVRVIYSTDTTKPAGFERTQEALVTILNQLSAPDVRDFVPEPLVSTRNFASSYLAACELSRPRCPFYAEELDKLQAQVPSDDVNRLPYLEVCKLAHKQFCDGFASNDAAKKRVWDDVKKRVRQLEKQRQHA